MKITEQSCWARTFRLVSGPEALCSQRGIEATVYSDKVEVLNHDWILPGDTANRTPGHTMDAVPMSPACVQLHCRMLKDSNLHQLCTEDLYFD